jgi:hypothetical protein
VTTPVPSEDASFSNLLQPDPTTKTGPLLFQVNKDWKKEFAAKSGITARLEEVGKEMVGEMEEIVPRASGALADSLYSEVVQGRDTKGKFTGAELHVGASADYSLAVEFGHHVPNSEEFVEPQPFIRPVVMRPRNFK